MTGWTGRWRVGAYAWLSIATAIATIGLKAWGYWLTNSVALFSDALESLINLVTAVLAAWMLWLSAQPPDKEHSFGHDKFEYFSSGLELFGALALRHGNGCGLLNLCTNLAGELASPLWLFSSMEQLQ